MYLRRLEIKDAPNMLSWMHDESITEKLMTDFSSKTLYDAEEFIKQSWNNNENLHLSISSDDDEYMGTVSLKHIQETFAEFAITVRSEALGKGYSWYGMEQILKIAFKDLLLNKVYWCVSKDNNRAVRFYEKHGFQVVDTVPKELLERYKGINNLAWYSVDKGYTMDKAVAGCKIININSVSTNKKGKLSYFEETRDIPFNIKRIYYITNVPKGVKRGFHAHKELKQLLFCPYGEISITLENAIGREEIELSDPSIGILVEQCTWREMLWLKDNSVLCVAASDYYKEDDYIRDYEEFRSYIGG